MGFKDELVNDLDNNFFNGEEFAEDILIKPSSASNYTVKGIFDRAFEGVDPETEAEILSTNPIVRLPNHKLEHDLSDDPGTTFEIRSLEYKMITFEPDGVGTVIIQMHTL